MGVQLRCPASWTMRCSNSKQYRAVKRFIRVASTDLPPAVQPLTSTRTVHGSTQAAHHDLLISPMTAVSSGGGGGRVSPETASLWAIAGPSKELINSTQAAHHDLLIAPMTAVSSGGGGGRVSPETASLWLIAGPSKELLNSQEGVIGLESWLANNRKN